MLPMVVSLQAVQQRPEGPWSLSGGHIPPWRPETEMQFTSGTGPHLQSKAIEFEDRILFSPWPSRLWTLNRRAAGFHDSRWLVFAILVKTLGFESITQLKGFLKHKGPPRFSDCSLLLQSKQCRQQQTVRAQPVQCSACNPGTWKA